MHPEDEGPDAVRRATDACLKLLSMRGRSRRELEQALARKGFTEAVCEAALARVKDWGYLDDERFARERATLLLGRGRLGPDAVAHRLRAHGLEEGTAQQAISEASDAVSFDALATARAVLEKRGLLGRPLGAKERARAGRLLDSRGFSEDVIYRLLGEASLDPSGPEE
ncbi:regulatory protein RecX [Myxococcus xanthus]|uniref:Regulatory protein RecX n=1 Tax=Myxococcus xanthus TaxID=34 RepID=A0AAE6KRJ3_MYXXA|nr:regulatory protein RecX [Myxococcus xanthus]QDE67209.1 RecX family transcriptional regulator [Myxococcus xanthus]QDE74484.1 RecX family transcriptional regulator [Myxococcus xanthus]QDE96069.1 RecX family transcriptional regulator [Myxococcus xanthus]